MRLPRRVLSTMVTLFALTTAAQAQEVPRIAVEARPSAVTVYPAQASVTRAGRVEIPAGDSLIVIAPVPSGIVGDSITARGEANAPVTIGGVDIRQASFDPSASNQRRAAIEAAIRPLDDQIAAVDVRLAAWAAQAGLIGHMQTRSVEALMTIRSYHARPIEVTIHDQILVSGETEPRDRMVSGMSR